MSEFEWERRRPGELTTVYLGRVLEDYLHIPDMAKRAREGHFDDYFCPPEVADGMELHRLLAELGLRAKDLAKSSPQRKRINSVANAVITGEFDGTREEARRWGASKEGQETFSRLMDGL